MSGATAVVVGTIGMIWVTTVVLAGLIIWKRPTSATSNPPPEPPSTVPVRTEFLEQLLLRSLRLDRPSPQGEPSQEWVMQAEDARANRPAWETDYPLPMEQALAMELEETKQRFLAYQSQSQEEMDYQESGYQDQWLGQDLSSFPAEEFLASFQENPEQNPQTP